jgi:hypothetical protein
MPSLCAMNSSGRTVVFISISTMSIATDGMSAMTTRLSEFANARSTLPRTKLTLSFLSSRMRTVGSRSSMGETKSTDQAVCYMESPRKAADVVYLLVVYISSYP